MAELDDVCWKLPKKKAENPFIGDDAPEMDETPDFGQYLSSWCQSLIWVLSWMMEIDRVDIITKVSIMASQMAMPR